MEVDSTQEPSQSSAVSEVVTELGQLDLKKINYIFVLYGPDQVQLIIFEIVSKKTDNLSCHLQLIILIMYY